MSPFVGGSAPSMATQIAEGYLAVTPTQLRRLTDQELTALYSELERVLRMCRAEVVPVEDQAATQAKNRKLSRLTGAITQVQAARARRGRGFA